MIACSRCGASNPPPTKTKFVGVQICATCNHSTGAEAKVDQALADVIVQLGKQERMAIAIIAAEHDAVTTLRIAERILVGQQRYGCLDLLHDPRNWHLERQEELDDAAAYDAFARVKAIL